MVLEEHGTLRHFSAGETIFKAGDEGRHMYVIDSGRVEIVAGPAMHEVRLSVLGPEEIFGEMSLFGGGTHSATARALIRCGVREINKEDVHEMVRDPLARQLLRVMGERLREVDAKLAQIGSETELTPERVRDLIACRSRFG
jgi:CRP-like cAMP-binding protein